MNTPLSTFPAPLLRLILCGGGGLGPAWGPLILASRYRAADEAGAWCGDYAVLRAAGGHKGATGVEIDEPDRWSLPLDAESPWPARLALVAAWMMRPARYDIARLYLGDPMFVSVFAHEPGYGERQFSTPTNPSSLNRYALQTLPQHLQTHPAAVALVLALWDIPEIRARIEAL